MSFVSDYEKSVSLEIDSHIYECNKNQNTALNLTPENYCDQILCSFFEKNNCNLDTAHLLQNKKSEKNSQRNFFKSNQQEINRIQPILKEQDDVSFLNEFMEGGNKNEKVFKESKKIGKNKLEIKKKVKSEKKREIEKINEYNRFEFIIFESLSGMTLYFSKKILEIEVNRPEKLKRIFSVNLRTFNA